MTSYFQNMSQALHKPEDQALAELLDTLEWDDMLAQATQKDAVHLIEKIRKTRRKSGSLESFFQQYDLNTEEGLALMALAEALLRIPDSKTANALIRDKVAGTNWLRNTSGVQKDWMTKVAGLGLKISGNTMNGIFSRIGEPVIREAMTKAMKVLGKQFIVGETLTGAMKTATKWEEKGFRFSYDMLGEGARTAEAAQHYFESYKGALYDLIEGIGETHAHNKPGISVKLSALHSRYEFVQKDNCLLDMQDKLLELCEIAAKNNLTLTIDAEEAARLDPSLELFSFIMEQSSFKSWDGFGLAVQAYQKTALSVIDYVTTLAKNYDKKIQVRLVKGAYWDTEIKQAQVEGLDQYPVYTRKSNTDVSYLACTQKLLNHRDILYPMFGTHNAYTVAAVLSMAGEDTSGFEFQKLFGMGDALYKHLMEQQDVRVCMYAPVGSYEELLPYLVRRMLENGANSSFVNQIYNKDYAPEEIAFDPIERAQSNEDKANPKIPLPKNLYGETRENSQGLDLNDPLTVQNLQDTIERDYTLKKYKASSIIAGKQNLKGTGIEKRSPAHHIDVVGHVYDATEDDIENAMAAAQTGFQIWSNTIADHRARTLEKFSDLLEENYEELIALCCREAGKTIKDAVDEVREAVDFCRYYAMNGRVQFHEQGRDLPGPTGEKNTYVLQGRGVFVCISPWNFPLAIFTGQITASLMAGNAVIAKPAEQTSLIAGFVIRLMQQAGVPPEVVQLVIGDGRAGHALVQHDHVSGVTFTGSTEVAKNIQQTLAEKDGPIVPLIAETGGQNAMIVDSSALTEQVVDDVILSAFGSAGQRCSACRVLYLQNDIADRTIEMLKGAMEELHIGIPSNLSTDMGPVIDEEALAKLQRHRNRLSGIGKKIAQSPMKNSLEQMGHFFAPRAYEIDDLSALEEEVFGPVLHIIRYNSDDIDDVIRQINATGYGLTFGIHSRIDSFVKYVTSRVKVGNIYVNRGTTGAVVGVQPFGGRGLSGTGPKAGGPQYLRAFATEKVTSINTTAAGGNASLVMLEE